MNQSHEEGRTSFVVRFYTFTLDPLAWRGQVEHVQSGQKSSFHGSQHLLEVMEKLAREKTDTDAHERKRS